MMRNPPLTYERLRKYMYYHSQSGAFVALVGRCAGRQVLIAAVDARGYRRAHVHIDGVKYTAGRVAWFYHYGIWPSNEIGYHNGDATDCAIHNLFDGAKIKHGYAPWRGGGPTYRAWKEMRGRCTNPKNTRYHRYGGRGIKICERWEDFANFLADMGERPSPRHSLDRYPNNNGDYDPHNCRWATAKQQAHSNYQLRPLSAFGRTLPLGEWAAEVGMARSTLRKRLAAGMNVEAALSKPTRFHYVDAFGERLIISEWARRTGIKPSVIWYRIMHGWTPERAVTEKVGKTGEWQRRQIVMERNLIDWR